jgi:hypothetical protein
MIEAAGRSSGCAVAVIEAAGWSSGPLVTVIEAAGWSRGRGDDHSAPSITAVGRRFGGFGLICVGGGSVGRSLRSDPVIEVATWSAAWARAGSVIEVAGWSLRAGQS